MSSFRQDASVTCHAGFDGGHEAQYHLEVYEQPLGSLVHNVTSSDPRFDLRRGLLAARDYALLLYASNELGRGPTKRVNVTTPGRKQGEAESELQRQRAAETRSVNCLTQYKTTVNCLTQYKTTVRLLIPDLNVSY